MFNSQITNIRYITIKKNWHRNFVIAAMSRNFPVTPEMVPGIIYDEKSKDHSKYITNGIYKGIESERTKGVIGCWIAHSKAIETISTTEGITVVLEDDFICTKSFFADAQRIINNISFDFDVLLFDPWGKGPLEIHKVQEHVYHPVFCGYPFYHGTHCIFINNSSIPKILAAKTSSHVVDYDGFLLTNNEISTYVVYTGACTQRAIGSDVTPKHKKNLDLPLLLAMALPTKIREQTHAYNRHFKPRNNKNSQRTFAVNATANGFYRNIINPKKLTEINIEEDKYILKAQWFGDDLLMYPVDENYLLSKNLPLNLKLTTNSDGHVTAFTLNGNDHWQKLSMRPPHKLKVDVPNEYLSKFQGKYIIGDISANIVASKDHLVVEMNYLETNFNLFPCGDLEFFCDKFPLTQVDFSTKDNGSIDSLTIYHTLTLKKVSELAI